MSPTEFKKTIGPTVLLTPAVGPTGHQCWCEDSDFNIAHYFCCLESQTSSHLYKCHCACPDQWDLIWCSCLWVSTVNPFHWLPLNTSIQDFPTNCSNSAAKLEESTCFDTQIQTLCNLVEPCGTQDLNLIPVSQFQITLAKIKAVTEMALSR